MLCELCGLPAAPHQQDDCLVEVRRKLKLADEMFTAAIQLVHALGDPVSIRDEILASKMLKLDLITWRYAM